MYSDASLGGVRVLAVLIHELLIRLVITGTPIVYRTSVATENPTTVERSADSHNIGSLHTRSRREIKLHHCCCQRATML